MSLRFRAADFEPAPEIVRDSDARWPVGYDELEAHYTLAERLIGVAGQEGDDPTAPSRSAPYLHPGGALAPTSRRIWEAARGLGLHPFRLPLAFNHARTDARRPCVACGTCDLFACAIGAKNDLATAILPGLLRRGLLLRPRTVAVRQSKYTIPMQFHVMGRVVRSRRVRWAVAAGWVVVVALLGVGLVGLQRSRVAPLTAVLLIGSLGGWLSAFGGAIKDAPIEGFETLKFFRSPAIALAWSLLVASFTRDYLFVALCGLGYTVATIETYKTFFFPSRPRGKFAGRPVLYSRLLTWRHRFAPLNAAIWLAVLANIALAWSEPRRRLLGSSPAPSAAHVSTVSGSIEDRVATRR